jgi:hypothetical protein
LPSVLLAGYVYPSGEVLAALKLACLAALAWHAAALFGKARGGPASGVALAVATGLVWAAVTGMLVYQAVALLPFDFRAVMSLLDDARRTLVLVFGEHGVALALGALAALAAAGAALAWVVARGLRSIAPRLQPGVPATVACFGFACWLLASDLWYAADQLVLNNRWAEARSAAPEPSVTDYSALAVASRESVFVLQLESVTTHALFERAADRAGGYRERVPQPGMNTILKEGHGVLFPWFWANGVQTHRAWESILCGVSANLGESYAVNPLRLSRTTCLPAHLAGAGYRTIFFYSFFDLQFFNLGAFARRAGFQEMAYGPQLMAEGDRRHRWAYDDCVFYDRAFDHLAKSGLARSERVFAYFEVGMNHSPFSNTDKYPDAHPHREPKQILEHYVNSVSEQDHCLLRFWQRFRSLGRDDVHLFILPDHGLWIPGLPPQPDPAFATWLIYVPPLRRQAEFRPRAVLAPVPSQAQLYPTILELLGAGTAPASFAFALRGEAPPPGYHDCHALTDGGNRLVVRRGGERVEYRPESREASAPGGVRMTMDYPAFWHQFGC